MIERDLAAVAQLAATQYPLVTITGPRQSGKTTLCRQVFRDHTYVTLEPLDVRRYAIEDPRGFLREHAGGAIFDEIQNAPDLASYLQQDVDDDPTPGRFILTGSQHFGISAAISQSLAGRTAVLHLLPPSLDELRRFSSSPDGLIETLFTGAYPRIHDRRLAPNRWLMDYVTTYVQRDVRQLGGVGDLTAFTTFLRMSAGRTSAEINLQQLGADVGVSNHTARAWLSVLEASFIAMRLPPWFTNVLKRLVKRSRLHFLDSGLACALLGIRSANELRHHPLRGAIFESWAVSEVYKSWVHAGRSPRLYHLRQTRGREVDLVIDDGLTKRLVEMKSGETVVSDWLATVRALASQISDATAHLVYGGAVGQMRSDVEVVPWREIGRLGPSD